jgi:ribosomal protein S18 acetylase RimI-like enzyme
MASEALERDGIVVRRLSASDLEPVIALDARITGRRRTEFFRLKLKQSLDETGIMLSLAAEADGLFAGFMLSRVYYGEFGTLEPVAVLDTLGVHPDFRRRGVGTALLDQLRTDLTGIGVQTLRTEVSWDDMDLIGFFHREGFRMAGRLCLDLEVTPAPDRDAPR